MNAAIEAEYNRFYAPPCETCGGCCDDCTEEADCQSCIDNRPVEEE